MPMVAGADMTSGFYSLFSVTEEPWVFSGGRYTLLVIRTRETHSSSGQWMNFYWKDKKDQVSQPHHILCACINV